MNLSASLLAVLALGACALLAVLARSAYRARGAHSLAPLYLDEGLGSRTFVSARYRLRAKPDKLEGHAGEATLVELKGRAGGLHAADRAQMIATALAVRAEGIEVTRARLETLAGAPVTLDLAEPDEELFARIRPAVEAARLAVSGIPPVATPSRARCRACGYRAACPNRADRRGP